MRSSLTSMMESTHLNRQTNWIALHPFLSRKEHRENAVHPRHRPSLCVSSATGAIIPPIDPPPLLPQSRRHVYGGQSTTTSSNRKQLELSMQATVTSLAKVASSPTVSNITIIGNRRKLQRVPLPPKGRSGDLEAGIWQFSDRQGTQIGNGNLVCRWATVARRLCWGELRLPLGSILIMGSSQTSILGTYSVIGGTGRYVFKQGVLTYHQLSIAKFVLRILLA